MASDYERREVVKRLRNGGVARDSEEAYVLLLSCVGIRPQLPATNTYEDAMVRIADLIDRPTCHVVRYLGVNSDGEREYEMACGSLFKRPAEEIMPYYCPWCGGRVVDEEEVGR